MCMNLCEGVGPSEDCCTKMCWHWGQAWSPRYCCNYGRGNLHMFMCQLYWGWGLCCKFKDEMYDPTLPTCCEALSGGMWCQDWD